MGVPGRDPLPWPCTVCGGELYIIDCPDPRSRAPDLKVSWHAGSQATGRSRWVKSKRRACGVHAVEPGRRGLGLRKIIHRVFSDVRWVRARQGQWMPDSAARRLTLGAMGMAQCEATVENVHVGSGAVPGPVKAAAKGLAGVFPILVTCKCASFALGA